jgi:hypothetical protein
MSLAISGTTATILNLITDTHFAASAGILRITATGGQLPTTATAANPGATQRSMIMCGFSSRTVLD